MEFRRASPLFVAAIALGACTIDTRLGSDGSSSAPDAFAGPHVCSIGMVPPGQLSDTMTPGEPCVSCHLQNAPAAPTALAGTIYAGAHEPDGCQGQSSTQDLRLIVQIGDMNGNVTQELTVNSVGNFFTDMIPPNPYTARVLNQATGAARIMMLPQTSGDCNACHTESGTTTVMGAQPAPGRIIAP